VAPEAKNSEKVKLLQNLPPKITREPTFAKFHLSVSLFFLKKPLIVLK